MAQMKYCELDNRRLVRIGNSEAESFLQGILTCNLDNIGSDKAGFGGLLTPQGKILFDFIILREGDGFILDVGEEQIDELVKRLTFYRLRADVSFEVSSDGTKVFACWGNSDQRPEADDIDEAMIVTDPRLGKMGCRIYSKLPPAGMQSANVAQYHAHRIALGIPEGGTDYHYGDAFPHEALFDQTGGVDFSKGCYVGQEVVSRMHHRGTARKRIIQISSENPLPEAGTNITVSDKSVGEVTSVAGHEGLALVRLDRVRAAIDNEVEIMAGDSVVTVQIQPWAGFGWPGDKQAN